MNELIIFSEIIVVFPRMMIRSASVHHTKIMLMYLLTICERSSKRCNGHPEFACLRGLTHCKPTFPEPSEGKNTEVMWEGERNACWNATSRFVKMSLRLFYISVINQSKFHAESVLHVMAAWILHDQQTKFSRWLQCATCKYYWCSWLRNAWPAKWVKSRHSS